MGSSVGAAARAAGARVLWASQGRSESTRERAEADALEEIPSLGALLDESAVVLSICPPHAAAAQAEAVATHGYNGIYVDANAVSPNNARSIARTVEAGGARFVDGGIIGLPVRHAGTTRLYLSGDGAEEIAGLFAGSTLEALPIAGGAGAASALKMCFAAYTKGSAALLTAIRALATREGVDTDLLAEWERSQPGLGARSEAGARATAPKAWRFAGEMEEIAATFEDAGLPDGFHRAAAELYARLESFKDAPPPELDAVLQALLRR
jgi:3-hydroxyisobutyrate dehydrogenase-like beta-hydroxyacid dehydrogenase